ncbi:helicase with zinc finger domain 2-like isoform X2 [Mya arenaria]|nr:helicase with zinc finger domain 2-like isoform X2 [Mya arenaria]
MTKKSKKKNKSGTPSQTKTMIQKQQETESESDESSGSPGPEDDTEFANMLTGVKSGSAILNGGRGRLEGGLKINMPTAEEEAEPWSFPHDAEEEIVPGNTGAAGGGMGLDTFSPTIHDTHSVGSESASAGTSNPSSGRSSRASQSPAKTLAIATSHPAPSLSPPSAPQIDFPLLNDYDFMLVCKQCFLKIGEGVKGFRYVSVNHNCARDTMIVKRRDLPGMHWIKIRPRPDAKGHIGKYKVCKEFNNNKPCKVSEEKCTFPHTQAELQVWSLDREGRFCVNTFLEQCRANKIFNNISLSAHRSKQQYIPGLNYVGNKNRKPTLEITAGEPIGAPGGRKAPTMPALPPPATQPVPQPPTQQQPVHRYSAPTIQPVGHQVSQFSLPHSQQQNPLNSVAAPYSQQSPFSPTRVTDWAREAPAIIEESVPEYQTTGQEIVKRQDNPLADSHSATTACQFCFKPTMYPGIYDYYDTLTHKCEETMLAMRSRDGKGPWVRVRERKNHREFPGNYVLCNCIKYKNPAFCKYGEELCSFAHNDVEKFLWKLEKDGRFDITEYMIQIKKHKDGNGFNLQEFLAKHGGYFEFICRGCYYGTPPKISMVSKDRTRCAGIQPHLWKDFKILAFFGPSSVIAINPRGFTHKSAFFKICKYLIYCSRIVNASCKFAHSVVERDLWMVERDTNITREEIVRQSKEASFQTGAPSLMPAQPAKATPTSVMASSGAVVVASQSPTHIADAFFKTGDVAQCPTVTEVCETCWKRGQKTLQTPGKDRCQKNHANWSCNVVYLLSPSLKELRPLPKKIPKGLNFLICKYIQEGKKCGYTGTGPCQYAHCNDELEAWKYMCINGLKAAAELSEASKAAQKARAEASKPKISGQSVVTATQATGPVRPAMPVPNKNTFYCNYCGVFCNSQKQWDEHCVSDKHNFNVNSDKEHHWNYRQPPWTPGKYYELCHQHMSGEKCHYSHVPDMYNLCQYAHSQDELDEWQERYQWRQMKRDIARQEKVFSYMDELLEKYENSTEPIKIISEELDGVEVVCHSDLHIYKEEKETLYTWTFLLSTLRPLEKVSLLYTRDRLHFSLVVGSERGVQISQGEIFCNNRDNDGKLQYKIPLKFTGGMFGSFEQWIVFDFGSEPVLCRKISVEIGDQSAHEKVRNLREQLHFDRWTSQNRQIVKHEQLQEGEEKLMAKYKEPSSATAVVTGTTVVRELNRHNYNGKMHKLLELEEMTRHQVISSYNLCVNIECLQSIQENTYLYALPGELFAKVPLQESLTEDTDAGRLILTSVRKVLLAPQDSNSQIVYEAVIVKEENFNFFGGRDFIYLCLSPPCVQQLKLKPGSQLDVEIQFQMDRLFFCRMHFAVDHLESEGIVFPDVPKINPLRNEKHNLKVSSSVLNPDQMAAVRHIVAERTGYTPPFVLFGPFGTGKTETIAQATMVLLKETQNTKILICAQSNSAADLYIVKHLDGLLKKSGNSSQLCRLYQRERRVFTIQAEVKKYCLLSPGHDSIKMPTKKDIERFRIVIVTVTSSLELANLGLQGMFTHIFIDEAAQTLECESLMPLTLATERTCIVLAGDHQQISPKVYSEEARNQKFHQSLLERLYNYYDSHSNLINVETPLNILLSINYRSKMEILRFISAVFYGGPDVLKSEANVPSVLSVTPLLFYAVQGKEKQSESGVSYYNMSEVQEVVERVDELYQKWPEEWGPPTAREIGVVTPYYDQVSLIRKKLRERNPALKQVVVERVQGVQGKEFRAMFITTVRTRYLIDEPHIHSDVLSDKAKEDFGFLSDSKLLNTALTRAQSVVVVVGDPVALCAIGECSKVWQIYLKHCQNMGSLFPQNHSLESIKQQVQSLQHSPARERLLHMANERMRPQSQIQPKPQVTVASVWNQNQSKSSTTSAFDSTFSFGQGKSTLENVDGIDDFPYQTNNDVPLPPYDPSVDPFGSSFPQFHDTLPNVNALAGIGNTLQPGQSNPSLNAGPTFTGSQGITVGLSSLSISGTSVPQPIKSPLVPLNPFRGTFKGPAPLNTLHPRKMESFFDVGEDFTIDSDDVIVQINTFGGKQNGMLGQLSKTVTVREENGYAVTSNCDKLHLDGQDVFQMYSEDQLRHMLTDKSRYVKCILNAKDGNYYGQVKGNEIRVKIPSLSMCGQAMNGDEVVIEMVKEMNQMLGRVVGVLKRGTDLRDKVIVCRMGENSGVMVPIEEGLSPMFNVISQGNLKNSSEGNVCVYKMTKAKQVRFSHFEKVSPVDVNEKLFAVRFLKYDSKVYLPLCIVLGMISAQPDVVASEYVLDLEYHMRKSYNQRVNQETETDFPDGRSIPADLLNGRHVDMRDMWCFSIDPDGTGNYNQAFSIDEDGTGSYRVGVHITDVASVVRKDSGVDMESRKRGISVYPVQGQAIQMLPNRLATQLCSLKENEDRLAISVLMTVHSTGELTQINVQKSVVNCKKNFTYKEAEEIIHDPHAHEDYLKSCVFVLFEISNLWRRDRLGNAALCLDKSDITASSLSHQLVEEMTIMTEHHIAKILCKNFPEITPILVQAAPPMAELGVWKTEHAADAVNSIALTKPFLNEAVQETCKCSLACTHTVNYVRQFNIAKREQIDVISILWDSLNEAVGIGDHLTMMNIVVSAENHPQIAVALKKLHSIQQPSRYVCYADLSEKAAIHYNINKNPYTSITSPLSCYMGIITQRLLLACLDQKLGPYTTDEIRAVCDEINKSKVNAEKYEQEYFALQLSAALLTRPLILQPLVMELNLQYINICFPTLQCLANIQKVDLALLGVCEDPNATPEGHVLLKWQERVYDYGILQHQAPAGNNNGELNADRFIYKIPAYHWQRLLIAVRDQDEGQRIQKLNAAIQIVGKQVCNPAMGDMYIEDVTSEVQKLGTIKHFAEFTMRLHASQVLLVQLSARLENAVLAPYLQLLSLTNSLDICLQHRQNPVESFVSMPSVMKSTVTPLGDVQAYKETWSAITEIEACTKAVGSNDRLLVNNVIVDWKIPTTASNHFLAELTLPVSFMKARQIKLSSTLLQSLLFNPKNSTYCNAFFSDFICLRYANITVPDKTGLSDSLAKIVNNRCAVTWVGHCVVIGVTHSNDRVTFKLKLIQSDVPLSLPLIQRRPCSVEFILRSDHDRMVMYGLKNLENASQLATDVALRQTPSVATQYADVDQLMQSSRQILHVPNQQQEEALKHALAQPLCVIQGCVGSGKSMMAAKLGYMFAQRNQALQAGGRLQVLVCAPTEAGVDLVNGYFMSLNSSSPRVVRVYSPDVERVLHPPPRVVSRSTSTFADQEISQIKNHYSSLSLYELIRGSNSPYCKSLKEYEGLFSLYPDDIADDQFEDYIQLVSRAESAVLAEAEIILCTCTTSAQLKISSVANVQQIIVDDTNTGTEPEVLVPLSIYGDVKQVTLIGDINQAGPTVVNDVARQLGLGQSIMRSYLSTAVYLNIQYRVHEGIVDFPSRFCYDNRLLCGSIAQRQPSVLNWPGGRNKPVAFCQLDGQEQNLPMNVVGAPAEQKCVNLEQADFVVQVAVSLVRTYNVAMTSVGIVCPSRAQCKVVKDKLAVTGCNIPCFTLHEIQGLEFDYVLFSTIHSLPAMNIEQFPTQKWLNEKLGVLTDHGQVISTLSRARKGLVIVGNENLLRCDKLWNRLLTEYSHSSRLVTAGQFLKAMSM